MMKKNGFTLAEVLITLAIIGVVAVLTLPALMTNTGEQQYKTSLKKGINILTEAAQMHQAVTGFDYGSLTSSDTSNENEQSLYSLLRLRTAVDYNNTGNNTSAANLVNGSNSTSGNTAGTSSNYVVFFRDGSALSYNPSSTIRSAGSGDKVVSKLQNDGLVYGIPVVFDTNGKKGPNLLSNCNSNAALTISSTSVDSGTCQGKSRVIKDQFAVRLRGSFAVPNGPAARWAYEN